jgi:hypothetical protein
MLADQLDSLQGDGVSLVIVINRWSGRQILSLGVAILLPPGGDGKDE